jgi:hypothetical protein
MRESARGVNAASSLAPSRRMNSNRLDWFRLRASNRLPAKTLQLQKYQRRGDRGGNTERDLKRRDEAVGTVCPK